MSFFKQNLLIYFIVEYFMQTNMTDDPFESFTEVTLQIFLTLIFISFILRINNMLYAFIEVTSSILVCANTVSFFIIPVLIWLTVNEDILSYYCLALLLIWEFIVMAYILKKTLAINSAASLALSALYYIITYLGAFSLGQILM